MTDNKSLEESFAEELVRTAEESFARRRAQDLNKLSYHFAIPVEDLEKALRTRDE